MLGNQLWVKKYRPDTLDGYVFKDDTFKKQMENWINKKDESGIPIPNLLFVGKPGSGKTTAAKILINCLGVQKMDVLEINASRENNVDTIRNKVQNFCAGYPFGRYKIVLMEEGDGLTGIAQGILRAEIERFEETVRFIVTANYKNKFIPAILSRFQVFDFLTLDLDSYFYRITEILDKENVEYSEEDVVEFVDSSFPDLRSGINLIQQHVVDNKLQKLVANTEGNSEYLIEAVELFKKGDYKKARNIICSRAVPDDYPEIYRYFYKNLQLFSDDIYNQDKALIIIKNGMIYHSTAIDPEINLAATIAELSKVNE